MHTSARYFFLFPFSMVYGCITGIRNWLYDRGICVSELKKIPVVVVGNLTVGGTGKTPHTEFLLDQLGNTMQVAVLSRGYKRHTRGFVLATPELTARELGDEPKQMALKFPHIPVAVCENRSKGIDRLVECYPGLQLIILDDAFQHRRIKPGISILLTDYNRLHTRDSLLPGGNLREMVAGSLRAAYIIVTKCPPGLSNHEMAAIEQEVKTAPHQMVLFSTFDYGDLRPLRPDSPQLSGSNQQSIGVSSLPTTNSPVSRTSLLPLAGLKEFAVLLVTGIVSPQQLQQELSTVCKEIHSLRFPDHHEFSAGDFLQIEHQFTSIKHAQKLIITTEKDAARLIHHPMLPDSIKKYIFVVPVKIRLLNDRSKVLIQNITDYVRENSGNR